MAYVPPRASTRTASASATCDRAKVDMPSCALIVSSAIGLAHDLCRQVVAEGVEDQPTINAHAAAGCDTIQGWYTGRPVSAATIRLSLQGLQLPHPRREQHVLIG